MTMKTGSRVFKRTSRIILEYSLLQVPWCELNLCLLIYGRQF